MAHMGIIQDQAVRAQNEADGKPLCSRCEGTGNELYAMYRRCSDCGGSGVGGGSR